MDKIVFTPRRTDFLKDGGIFAHSPAVVDSALQLAGSRAEPTIRSAFCLLELLVHTAHTASNLQKTPHGAQRCNSVEGLFGCTLYISCRPQHESTAARILQNPNLHAPQPRHTASGASAQAVWAPQASGLSANALYGQDDIAKQIRAKFENLVRASPLPKARISF